jgi:large subunit ribosomal protein L17
LRSAARSRLVAASRACFNRYGDVRKAPRLVQHIMTTVAPMFSDRDGGYTRIVKLGKNRLGDGTDLVLLQLVGREEGPELSGGTSGRRRQADRRTAFAAKLRKGGEVEEPAVGTAEPEEPTTEPEAVETPPEVEGESGDESEQKQD